MEHMEFKDVVAIAKDVRASYHIFETKFAGKPWSREQIAQGFVGDVGDLMKLIMAKEGIRAIDDVDAKLAHELSDCLWSILVLADKYGIDLESEFTKNMQELKAHIDAKNAA